MGVPIQNVYYLLCYAWDRLDCLGTTDVGSLKGDRIESLLGKVLHDGVTYLVRQGLDRGYEGHVQTGRQLRGKVLLTESVSRMLFNQGLVACEADELSCDVQHNRVLKAAMRQLSGLPAIDRDLASKLRHLCHALPEVADIDLRPDAFRSLQLHQNLIRYSFLVGIARLVASSLVPTEGGKGRVFRPFTANEQEMGGLFEAFVRNFLRREQQSFKVTAPKVTWALDGQSGSDPSWLPQMKTDIVLSRNQTHVVVETKCYTSALQKHHHGVSSLRSANLYQLLTYVTHYKAAQGVAPIGVLLYAGVEPGEPLTYRLGGHDIRVRNLDLDQPWGQIRHELLQLASEFSSAA